MQIIKHRINSSDDLHKTDKEFGVEVDLRTNHNQIILQHDPFSEGEVFTDWIKNFDHKTLILNVKEDGLEKEIINILKENSIEDFFFLDLSFPFLVKTAISGETRIASRVSEFESLETIEKIKDLISWVWIDYFSYFPLKESDLIRIKDLGLRTCIVSPELQGFDPQNEVSKIKDCIINYRDLFDAVCTKYPELWT